MHALNISKPSRLAYTLSRYLLSDETFVQQQNVVVAFEVIKSVLDSRVRYEQQLKETEPVELTETVIDKVLASIKDEKTQREVLLSTIAEMEREHSSPTTNKLLRE